MENGFLIAAASSLWFGILTSVSPCPLATNIAAISYIGKNIDSTFRTLLSGIFYSIGRAIAYTGISAIIVASVISVPALSMFLQTKINMFLGPILIVTGLILTGLIKLSIGGNRHSERAEKLTRKGPYIGSVLIGFLFALAFCPVSAALFFGSMLPISLKHQSFLTIPAIYGLGTALPVIGFAILLSTGTQYIGTVFKKLTSIEIWVRRITGAIFILIGIYFTLIFIFKIQIF
ncbi:aromatic aminobenezylarsenical efflux permease ArsG family transporter [Spirochaetota bacterium]